jgi:DNA helicase-2/ATP-dependent DNA helicase PcrA
VDHYEAKGWYVVSTEFDFLEPDDKKRIRKEKLVINDADTSALRAQVRMVWDRIQQRDFYTGCGKEDCHWCNFVKTNKLAVALHTLETEQE